MASMPVETKMTGRQFVEAVVMGVHFPPVRAYQKSLRQRTYLRKSDQQHDNLMGNGAILTS